MNHEERRLFVAEMRLKLKYCHGRARKTEQVFGWGGEMVKIGLGEKLTGILASVPNSQRALKLASF